MKKYKAIISIEISDGTEDIERFIDKIENTIFIPAYSIFGDFIGLKPKV